MSKNVLGVWLASTVVAGSVSLSAAELSLEECAKTALQCNPDARAAGYRVEAAAAMIDQARSAFYPQVHLSGGLSRTDNAPQAFMMRLNQRDLQMSDPAFNANDPDDTENIRLSAAARYRLFDGARRERTAIAGLGEDAAREQLATTRNELIHQVTRGYYGLLQATAFVEVRRDSVRSLEESLRASSERFKAGSVVKTDVLNIEVELAQAREDLIRAENGAQLAMAALNTAIGTNLVSAAGLLQPPPKTDAPQPAVANGASIENRPELHAAHTWQRMKARAYREAVRDYLPTLDAFGSVDWDSDSLSDFQDSYTVGVALQWEAFSGGRRSAAVAQARAEWQAAMQQEQKARNELALDLRRAELGASEARERLAVTAKSVESAEEALRITRDRYEQGAADITELLVAETRLTGIRTRDVAAYYDCLIARSNLERAMGVLFGKYESEE